MENKLTIFVRNILSIRITGKKAEETEIRLIKSARFPFVFLCCANRRVPGIYLKLAKLSGASTESHHLSLLLVFSLENVFMHSFLMGGEITNEASTGHNLGLQPIST